MKEPTKSAADALFDAPAPEQTGFLTDADKAALRAEAKERVNAAMKDAESERFLADEMAALRREEGQRTGNVDQDELVPVLIDVAEYARIDKSGTGGIAINGVQFQYGRTYNVPRHVKATIEDIKARSFEHQATIDGKPKHEYFRRQQETSLSFREFAA